MTVPVSHTLPVSLAVGVDIPLEETELGTPFATLEGLFTPLDTLIEGLPASNDELMRRVTGSTTEEKAPAAEPLGSAGRPR